MMIEILNRYTSAVIYASATATEIAQAVAEAVSSRADLTGADLTDADLTGADLTGADLTDANLTGANLTDADLTGADLTDADLTGADLTGADLTDANLTDADLTGADLTDADLTIIHGSRHRIVAVGDDVRIGCMRQSLVEWMKTYVEVGTASAYSATEIEEYGEHLRHIGRVIGIRKKEKSECPQN
jgi:hypothetical protein